MSAWLVTKEHIDVVVTAAIALDLITEDQATATGEMLWQENARSLRFRYSDADESWDLPEPGSYRFTPYPIEDLFFAFKQVRCLDYQACECMDYTSTECCQFCDRLTGAILARLGMTSDQAYAHIQTERAPWGVPA